MTENRETLTIFACGKCGEKFIRREDCQVHESNCKCTDIQVTRVTIQVSGVNVAFDVSWEYVPTTSTGIGKIVDCYATAGNLAFILIRESDEDSIASARVMLLEHIRKKLEVKVQECFNSLEAVQTMKAELTSL